jgi:predicted murein hydrolase (TIGR00659 family)
VTLLAYLLAFTLYRKAGDNPLLNPVALAVALLIVILLATGTPYATYFEGAQFVHFLLGPATVALAVPLYRQLGRLRRLWLPVAVAVVVGVTVAALSAVAIAALLGGSVETQLSLAPKSVTAPVAMGIAEKLGGLPSLTAVLVVATGILGAVTGTRLLSWCGVRDDAVRGIAMGVTSHGIGTARAFQVSPAMGAFSGLGMALSAFATALLVPWLVRLLGVSG